MSKYQDVVFLPKCSSAHTALWFFIRRHRSSIIIYRCTYYVSEPVLTTKRYRSWLLQPGREDWNSIRKCYVGKQMTTDMENCKRNSEAGRHTKERTGPASEFVTYGLWVFLLPSLHSIRIHVSVILLSYVSVGITCKGHEDTAQNTHSANSVCDLSDLVLSSLSRALEVRLTDNWLLDKYSRSKFRTDHF